MRPPRPRGLQSDLVNPITRVLSFVRPYWRRAVVALVLLTSLVFLDLSIPRLIQRLIDQGINQHSQPVIIQTGLLMLAISIVSTFIAIGNNQFSIQVGEGAARDLRQALFHKIQDFAFGDLDRHQTGQLMVRLTSDVDAVKRLIQITLRIGTRAPFLMLGSLLLMFSTSRTLALAILPLLLLTMAVIVGFIVGMEPLFRTVQRRLDRLNTVLQENLAGVRVVKSFVRGPYEGRRFEAANEDFTERTVRVMQVMSVMTPALTMLVNAGIVLVIWFGGRQAIAGGLSIGQIVAFTNYLMTTMTPLVMMTMLSNTWASGLASAGRVHQVLDVVPEVQDAPDASSPAGGIRGRVVFEDVGFHYGDGGEAVLRDINLVAEPGQTLAILGATGSGKSTLVNLVPRFYDASSGRVLIDGVDVRRMSQEALLRQIGLVPQDSILFTGTVSDNIRYGAPEASDDEVIAAARAAQAHEFIQALPEGYDTPVEQRGTNFSGGQKQRLAIARALLLRPRILILDDATSAVDVETETRIQDALDASDGGRTTLVVAQRISTVLRADQIVVLDRGRVIAQGRHEGLMQSSPVYREIYDSQLGEGLRLERQAMSGETGADD
jgi:ATP-binding cassette subfamily B multidrug efflux pump